VPIAFPSTTRTSSLLTFDQLYQERYQAMVRLARYRVDTQAQAEDIVQDAFHQVWQRWDTLDQPRSYLRRTVINGCHNELRRRKVRRDNDHKLLDSDDTNEEYLTDVLAGISERRRLALVLRYYGDRTLKEIAELMNVPTGTAKSLLHRGLADARLAIN